MTDPHAVPLDASDEPTDFVPEPMFPPTFAAPPVVEWPRPEPVVTGVEPPDEVAPLSPAPKAGKSRAAAVAVVALGLAATGVFYLKGQNHTELAAEPAKEKSGESRDRPDEKLHPDEQHIPAQPVTPKGDEFKPAEPPRDGPNSDPVRVIRSSDDSWAMRPPETPRPLDQKPAVPPLPVPPEPVGLKRAAESPKDDPMQLPTFAAAGDNRAGGPPIPAVPGVGELPRPGSSIPTPPIPMMDPDVVQAQAKAPETPKPAMPPIPDPAKPMIPAAGPAPSGPKPVEPLPKLPEKTDAPGVPALPKPAEMTLPSLPKTDAMALPSLPVSPSPAPGAMTLPVVPGMTSPIEMKPVPLTPPAPEFGPAPTSLPTGVTETKPSPQPSSPLKTELFNEVKQAESPQPAPTPAALPQPPALPALDFPTKPTPPAATPARETVPADPTVRRAEYEVNLVSVRRGDSYEAIAKDSLGDAKYGELLRRYNNDRELRPGEVVKVPPAPVLRKLAGPNWTGAPDAPKPAAPRTYTTARDGMSMWDIAYEVYGTKTEFRKVIDANRDRNPNLRYRAGERFRLPGE